MILAAAIGSSVHQSHGREGRTLSVTNFPPDTITAEPQHTISGGDVIVGRRACSRELHTVRGQFPKCHGEQAAIVAQGEQAAIQFHKFGSYRSSVGIRPMENIAGHRGTGRYSG